MLILIRHLIAIVALPFVMAVLVPIWLARRNNVDLAYGGTVPHFSRTNLWVVSLLIGLALLASSLRRFVGDGKGTLAPRDPPRELVINGPYRYVRNPMISGVMFVLFGEALILVSPPHVLWAVAFVVGGPARVAQGLIRFSEEASVKVYHDPSDPRRAVLSSGVTPGTYVRFGIACLLVPAGLLFPGLV